MAGKVKLKKKGVKTTTYAVSGDTLAAIWESIKANGPKDGGKARAGYTSCPVATPSSFDFDFEVTDDPKKKGAKQAVATPKGGEVEIECTIQMPKLASDKALSDAAKKEWKRFIAEVEAHEKEHVAESEKVAQAVADQIGALRGTGSDADEKKAKKAAVADFVKNFKAGFSGADHPDERLKKANKALDSGGHGPVLDLTIQ